MTRSSLASVAIGVLSLLFVGSVRPAEARCGKNSGANGRTPCAASSGDLLLKFEDFGGAASNDPLDDEYGAGVYSIRSGSLAGAVDAADPIILTADQARLHGQAMRFGTGDYLQIDDTVANQLRSKFEVYVSFWIRARDVGSQFVLAKLATATTCGVSGLCQNYSVFVNDSGKPAGKYAIAFQAHRGTTLMSCNSDLNFAAPLLDYGKWHHVTIGGFYTLNNENTGVNMSEGYGRLVIDGTTYETLTGACITDGGGAAREFVSAVAEAMPLIIGDSSGQPLDFDLDELRIDAWDHSEVLSAGCGAPKPGCPSCSILTNQTGCKRSRAGGNGNIIGRIGDTPGGVAVTQVVFNPDATRWESIMLYRKFESAGGPINLSSPALALCESDGAPPDDDGVESCFVFPASPAATIGPGEFVEVVLCDNADPACAASTASGTTCKQYFTKTVGSGLGLGATAKGDCTAGTCLNGTSTGALQTDLVSLVNPVTFAEKGGVAWIESGSLGPTDSAFAMNFETGEFGLWPVTYSGGVQGPHLAFELSNTTNGTGDVRGLKLRTTGSNANPDILDPSYANRDWVEILDLNNPPVLTCTTGAAATGSSPWLADFKGTQVERDVRLQWVTGDESALQGFNLYRSRDLAKGYEKIAGLIPARHSLSGAEQYFFDDVEPGRSGTVWYGLELIDDDGAVLASWPGLEVAYSEAGPSGCGCSLSRPSRSLWIGVGLTILLVGAGWWKRKQEEMT